MGVVVGRTDPVFSRGRDRCHADGEIGYVNGVQNVIQPDQRTIVAGGTGARSLDINISVGAVLEEINLVNSGMAADIGDRLADGAVKSIFRAVVAVA